MKNKKKFRTGSVFECPISEDVESEDQEHYFSDNSSSSTFSFKKKMMSCDLSKMIDKSESFIEDSSMIASKYYSNVNETIEEEEDDKEDNPGEGGLLSSKVFNRLKASHEKVNSFRFFDISKKKKKIRSICLENEPILEELEEY